MSVIWNCFCCRRLDSEKPSKIPPDPKIICKKVIPAPSVEGMSLENRTTTKWEFCRHPVQVRREVEELLKDPRTILHLLQSNRLR